MGVGAGPGQPWGCQSNPPAEVVACQCPPPPPVKKKWAKRIPKSSAGIAPPKIGRFGLFQRVTSGFPMQPSVLNYGSGCNFSASRANRPVCSHPTRCCRAASTSPASRQVKDPDTTRRDGVHDRRPGGVNVSSRALCPKRPFGRVLDDERLDLRQSRSEQPQVFEFDRFGTRLPAGSSLPARTPRPGSPRPRSADHMRRRIVLPDRAAAMILITRTTPLLTLTATSAAWAQVIGQSAAALRRNRVAEICFSGALVRGHHTSPGARNAAPPHSSFRLR